MDLAQSFLEIQLHRQTYAIPVRLLREITPLAEITPLPQSASHLSGLMHLRGRALPVVDLGKRLGLGNATRSRESCVVVVESSGKSVGLLVDAVGRLRDIPKQIFQALPEICHIKEPGLVTAIVRDGDRILTLLDVSCCVAEPAAPSTKPLDKRIFQRAVELLS
jgi:purine-binding chemotaxis protein CheW